MSRTDRLQALKALLSPHTAMSFDRLQSEREVPTSAPLPEATPKEVTSIPRTHAESVISCGVIL
jgi:hypothetical protein